MDTFKSYYMKNKNCNVLQSTKWIPYFDIYDKHSEHLKNKENIRILEIGVRHGGSLLSFKSIFNKPIIFGIDIDERCKILQKNYGFNIFIGNQSDQNFLSSFAENTVSLDMVIDDGSHIMSDIIISFEKLFPILNEDGVYIIEDLPDGKVNINFLKKTNDIEKIIIYDRVIVITKKIGSEKEIVNNLRKIKYQEKDRYHLGKIKLYNGNLKNS